MATFYLKSGAGAAEFAQSTAYVSGNKIVPKRSDAGSNFAVARRWVWECTTAGTTAAAEPTWPASVTKDVTTVTSGTAVFTARKPGFSSGTTADWAFATIYLDYINNAAAGDFIYISNNHAETIAAAYTPTLVIAGVSAVCVDDAVAPPTTVAATATITTTGNSGISPGATGTYFYGVKFIAGSGASGTAIIALSGDFEGCQFIIASTGGSSAITMAATCRIKDCDFKFSAATQGISLQRGRVYWSGGSLLSGGTSPTSCFSVAGGQSWALIEGLDLSAGSSSMNLTSGASLSSVGTHFRNIKMPASWSGTIGALLDAGSVIATHNVGTGVSVPMVFEKRLYGSITHESTIVRTGGSGTSLKFVSTASALFPSLPLPSLEIASYNSSIGSPITVTVEILRDSATALTDKEIALEVSYLSATDSPLGASVTSAPSIMASASDLAASSAVWTTTGMSNPNEQKLTVTFTPQVAGFIHATVKLFKPSTTVYVDPVLQIS